MMKYLQKLGKALMLPVAVLPICGILMGLGYALAPGVMGVPGAATSGAAYTVGFLLVKAGGALIDNMAWLFAIGAAVGLADNDGTAGLAGLVSFLMMQQLLSPGVVSMVRTLEEGTATYIAFQKVAGNSFIGILAAVVGAACYNKFKSTQMPDWLAFFSGKRFVAIATGLISILVSVVLLFVWPVIFDALVAIGNGIAGMDGIGAGIYAFLNRLLIPTGLHHALNNVFWFDTIGLGDLSHFWAGETSADVGWSLGMYMSGFFPCMMFGIAGAALAMVRTAKNKKAAIGLVLSAAICAFVCGVTEPFEFGFMFLCFPLYVVYSALYGIFTIITYYSGFRAGFCFSAGATDLIFSASLPAAAKTWMIIPLGIAAFLVFYFVFYFAITKFDLKTPGREDDDEEAEKKVVLANNNYTEVASAVLAAVGGKENVKDVGYCATRLRFEVKDNAKVDTAIKMMRDELSKEESSSNPDRKAMEDAQYNLVKFTSARQDWPAVIAAADKYRENKTYKKNLPEVLYLQGEAYLKQNELDKALINFMNITGTYKGLVKWSAPAVLAQMDTLWKRNTMSQGAGKQPSDRYVAWKAGSQYVQLLDTPANRKKMTAEDSALVNEVKDKTAKFGSDPAVSQERADIAAYEAAVRAAKGQK